ncbi:hypothetical protein [Micromonospora sp. WMMD712]|uniref:hypothetical protein n=1 Tax=Micromonospora sp. WMMD712 TaxID=3016096 RepID=UPI00249AC505|nr:hypothetical protein [Micromonospora sp. WMMD712]WFE59509.1 hypothetical protein O7633_22835 [Micromonospora sp. WMMD712]
MTAARASQPNARLEEPEAGRGTLPFLAVWVPSLGAVVASGVAMFALSWWITRSPSGGAHLGLIVGLSSVLSLTTMMVVSGILDHADRRRAVLLQLALMAAPLIALLAIFGTGQNAWTVLAAGGCYAAVLTVQTVYIGTMESIGADLAPADWPGPRVALLTQLHTQISRVAAPMVAGGLVAAGALRGVSAVSLALVLAALVMALLFARPFDVVTARHRSAAGPGLAGDAPTAPRVGLLRRTLRDAKASLVIIRSHRELVFLVWFGILANLVVAPFYAVLPAFIKEYGLPEQAQAVLFRDAASAYGIGLLLGSLALMRYRQRRLGAAALAFAAICGLLLTVTIAGQDWVIVPAMVLSGALFSVLVAVGGAAWLAHTPAPVRMRVFSLRRLVVFSSIPLGNVLMGVGGFVVGYRLFIRLLLILVLVTLAVIWWRFVWATRRAATA